MNSNKIEEKFIIDAMLGDVARWLRLLGYDTLYAANRHDREIIEIAEKEKRILVTRDNGLYRRAKKRKIKAILLENTLETHEKIAIILKRIGIRAPITVNPSQSRCPVCNGKLEEVKNKTEIRELVPPKVYESYDKFWVCTSCGRIYWVGSHWRKINETLEKINSKLVAERRKPQQSLRSQQKQFY